jgi:BclB C-terminal domain-containing protein
LTKLVHTKLRPCCWPILLLALLAATPAAALSTAFTYQGLFKESGLPVTGPRQMTFKLYDTATVGTGVQQGSTVGPLAVDVDEGLFIVDLDFGSTPFDGTDLWLEIDVAGTVIGRQRLTPAPFALFALNTGTPPAPAPSTIIPIASGEPVTITTFIDGSPLLSGLVGFGRSASAAALAGVIDITGGGGQPLAFAFSMPRDGTIASLSAFFSTQSAMNLVDTTVTITAQLYASTVPSNIFTPIPGAAAVLAPGLTGVVPSGTTLNGAVSGLSIPVTAQTRLMMVVHATAVGGTLVQTVDGYVGGGIGID